MNLNINAVIVNSMLLRSMHLNQRGCVDWVRHIYVTVRIASAVLTRRGPNTLPVLQVPDAPRVIDFRRGQLRRKLNGRYRSRIVAKLFVPDCEHRDPSSNIHLPFNSAMGFQSILKCSARRELSEWVGS